MEAPRRKWWPHCCPPACSDRTCHELTEPRMLQRMRSAHNPSQQINSAPPITVYCGKTCISLNNSSRMINAPELPTDAASGALVVDFLAVFLGRPHFNLILCTFYEELLQKCNWKILIPNKMLKCVLEGYIDGVLWTMSGWKQNMSKERGCNFIVHNFQWRIKYRNNQHRVRKNPHHEVAKNVDWEIKWIIKNA